MSHLKIAPVDASLNFFLLFIFYCSFMAHMILTRENTLITIERALISSVL